MLCPVPYYSLPADMWEPPEHGTPHTLGKIREILGEVAPDAPGEAQCFGQKTFAEIAPPEEKKGKGSRQTIAAVQQTETAESLSRVGANLPEDLSGRQSAEAEALERHTVFSTRVRAEALEQQKVEARTSGRDMSHLEMRPLKTNKSKSKSKSKSKGKSKGKSKSKSKSSTNHSSSIFGWRGTPRHPKQSGAACRSGLWETCGPPTKRLACGSAMGQLSRCLTRDSRVEHFGKQSGAPTTACGI